MNEISDQLRGLLTIVPKVVRLHDNFDMEIFSGESVDDQFASYLLKLWKNS